MNSMTTSMVVIPGVVALLLFLVFTYLYEQSRQQYFRAWQLAWGAYTLHFALDAWAIFGTVSYSSSFATQALLVGMGLCIFISTRLMRERYRFRWYDAAIVVTGLALVWWNLHRHAPGAVFHENFGPVALRMETGMALLLAYCAFDFFRYAQRKSSVAFALLGTSVLMWAGLMGFPSTVIVSVSGSALVPSSVTIWPLRETRPEVMISSALRREAMPAEARIFWRRCCMGEDILR